MASTCWTEAEVRAILSRRERDHLSWAELSRTVGEPVWRLRYWARKASDRASRFVELVDQGSRAGCERRFELELQGGVRVTLTEDFDAAALKRLLLVLADPC